MNKQTLNNSVTEAFYPWQPLRERTACCPTKKTLIEVQNLNLFYGDKRALADVSLRMSQGCITALVGPSGCGKTSFLMALNRLTDLIPKVRVTGGIFLRDQDILSPQLDVRRLRQQVGMIFQKPNPFPFSIRRNIVLTLKENGIRDREQQEHLLEQSLKSVGLWSEVENRLDSPALALSGGQQQRLCIARAIVLKPQVLLMDEPCSALDPISSGVVEDLITGLRGQYTVVIVTHNLAQARRVSDDVGVFWSQNDCGRLVEFGPVQQIFEMAKNPITQAYVGGARG